LRAESDTDATPFAHVSIDFYPDFFGFWFFVAIGIHESTFSFAGLCILLIHQSSKSHIRLHQKRTLLQGIFCPIFSDENGILKPDRTKAGPIVLIFTVILVWVFGVMEN